MGVRVIPRFVVVIRLFVIIVLLILPAFAQSDNNPPTALPTADPPYGEKPLTVLFYANADDADDDQLTYHWNFGDPCSRDNTSTQENPVHTYNRLGMYEVLLRVSDNNVTVDFPRAVRVGVEGVDYLLGDFDLDRDVDFVDFAIFANGWQHAVGPDTYYLDINGDGNRLDDQDIPIIFNNWLSELNHHWAIIVGISDYNDVADVNYCDEDATYWHAYFNAVGYEGYDHIFVLGDSNPSNYPEYFGPASEFLIKGLLEAVVNAAGPDDIISFVFSGGGGGDGFGSSYLKAWDSGGGLYGEDGDLWDYELADILSSATAKIFIFAESDKSGGMLDELATMLNAPNVYATSSCGIDGDRNDAQYHDLGGWTEYFLVEGLIHNYLYNDQAETEACFQWADFFYNPGGNDEPIEFDGNFNESFTLW
jgi:hypothetical protein